MNGIAAILSSGIGMSKRSRNCFSASLRHLLRLVRDHLAFAGLAHAEALHGLGEDHRRLVLVLHRRGIGRVDLERIVAAAIELPHLLVGQVGDQRLQLRRVEEVLAHVRAVLALEVLVLAVDAFLHALAAGCRPCPWRTACPSPSPRSTLITFQPAPRKTPSSSWMILPLPRTGPSRRCRLQLMTKIRLSSFSRPAERDRAERLRLVALAVAQERPHLAVVGLGQPAAFQILEEARLVDRHQRTEAHRHRGKLPEVGHQPRMRIRRNALAFAFLPVT